MGQQMQTDFAIREDGRATLVVVGEIDLSVAHDLCAAIDEACGAEPSELIIDLADVTYCDSTGIAQVVHAVQTCASGGTACRVVRAAPTVHRVFDVCGLGDMLEP